MHLHYFVKFRFRLLQECSRTKDRLLGLDAAPIGCQVEGLARQPVPGTAVRRVLASLQAYPWRHIDQIEVEPCVFFGVEPRFSGPEHERGMSGCHKLKYSAGERPMSRCRLPR